LQPGKYQPAHASEDAALKESGPIPIKAQGVIQPILVRPGIPASPGMKSSAGVTGAGEQPRSAGLATVPRRRPRRSTTIAALAMALIEMNIQRYCGRICIRSS
jgi:hypothetical protein